MSDWPFKGATQRQHDIAAYGFCERCGEPRRAELIETPDGRRWEMRCYSGHSNAEES